MDEQKDRRRAACATGPKSEVRERPSFNYDGVAERQLINSGKMANALAAGMNSIATQIRQGFDAAHNAERMKEAMKEAMAQSQQILAELEAELAYERSWRGKLRRAQRELLDVLAAEARDLDWPSFLAGVLAGAIVALSLAAWWLGGGA